MKFPDPSVALSVEQRIADIVTTIKAEEQRLREKYSILQYQDWIGFAIMLLSLSGMVGGGYLYYIDAIPAWLCIVSAAIFASLSHELEHDLIHRQYFRKNKFMHNLMMLVVWVMRPNTVSPWYRRNMHFLHHKVSGTEKDMEERLVGNGIAYGFMRFLVMFDGLLGMLARRHVLKKDIDHFSVREVLSAAFPFAVLYFAIFYIFLGFHGFDYFWGAEIAYPAWLLQGMDLVNFLVVAVIAPNFIRSGSLNFVTSAMHYYGGVDNLIQQTQILKPWFFAPLHLFCFNFGSTHAIHHFVVGQPFYIRQMVSSVAHKVMVKNGVKFNDFSTFITANRWVHT
ncbi:fatty acid desaturase [uncultured Oceanicoccus sp.]|uniref:fatty acid desaturase n=1 Tax=uncultured Oceanicoccus sp. TaxID=1706381 RepID=UPI0030DD6DA6